MLAKLYYEAVKSGERTIDDVNILVRPAVEAMLEGRDPETISPEEWDQRIEQLRREKYPEKYQ